MSTPVYIQLQMPGGNRMLTYDEFMNDLAARITERLAVRKDDPEMISQRQAYRMFGRANVERWLRQGKLHPHRRPGKVEYRTAELRAQQEKQQDYFT